MHLTSVVCPSTQTVDLRIQKAFFVFLPRDALYCKARYCDQILSVCLSVCPCVTFRYRDHIGWNSSKIISRPNSLRPLLFGAQRAPTYSEGNMGKFWGE